MENETVMGESPKMKKKRMKGVRAMTTVMKVQPTTTRNPQEQVVSSWTAMTRVTEVTTASTASRMRTTIQVKKVPMSRNVPEQQG